MMRVGAKRRRPVLSLGTSWAWRRSLSIEPAVSNATPLKLPFFETVDF